MKLWRYLSPLAITVLATAVVGCATIRMQWNAAQRENTMAAYESFLARHAESGFADSATLALSALYFSRAEKDIDPERAFERYLVQFPSGFWPDQARVRLDSMAYKRATDAASAVGFREYLKLHPRGKYTALAQKNLERLHLERCRLENSVAACEEYLSEFPNGDGNAAVRDQLDSLLFLQASKARTSKECQSYLDRFPNGRHASMAQQGLEQALYQEALAAGTSAPLEAYLKRYPEGAFSGAARAALPRARAGELSAAEGAAWSEAMAKDSLGALAEYLRSFPDTRRKPTIRKLADAIMVKRVEDELHDPLAVVSKRGVRGGSWCGMSGMGGGATLTCACGEMTMSGFLILCDPTEPIVMFGDMEGLVQISGRGIVVQSRPEKKYIYVFGVDVSSVVKEWYKWK